MKSLASSLCNQQAAIACSTAIMGKFLALILLASRNRAQPSRISMQNCFLLTSMGVFRSLGFGFLNSFCFSSFLKIFLHRDSPAALEVKSRWDHNHAPMSFSMTAAASIRPITRKMFIKSVIADSSLCLASHRFSMCSVGELLVAKYWTYLSTVSAWASILQSFPRALGWSNNKHNFCLI